MKYKNVKIYVLLMLFFFSANANANVCDRSESVVKALTEKLELGCESITDDNLKSLTELSVSAAGDLKSNDFSDMTNLYDLALYDGLFTTLPENIFDGLSGLRKLRIMYSSLMDLPENIFLNLQNLERIDLSRNKLRSLPNLKPLKELTFLDVSENLIEVLVAEDLQGLSKLNYINIFNNPIWDFQENIFENQPQLDTVGITFEVSPPDNIFRGLTSLRVIGINGKIELPENLFKDQNGLEHLYLNNVSLKKFSAPDAIALELTECTDFPDHFLERAPQLLQLTINDMVLDIASFGKSHKLEKLTIGSLNIMHISDSFLDGLSGLKRFAISGKALKSVSEKTFKNLEFLTSIQIYGVQFEKIPMNAFKTNSVLAEVTVYGAIPSDDQNRLRVEYPKIRFKFGSLN